MSLPKFTLEELKASKFSKTKKNYELVTLFESFCEKNQDKFLHGHIIGTKDSGFKCAIFKSSYFDNIEIQIGVGKGSYDFKVMAFEDENRKLTLNDRSCFLVASSYFFSVSQLEQLFSELMDGTISSLAKCAISLQGIYNFYNTDQFKVLQKDSSFLVFSDKDLNQKHYFFDFENKIFKASYPRAAGVSFSLVDACPDHSTAKEKDYWKKLTENFSHLICKNNNSKITIDPDYFKVLESF